MDDGRSLAEGAIDGGHRGHVRMRGNHDGRAMGLGGMERARGHHILVLWLGRCIRVIPLRHGLAIGHGSSIVMLGMMVVLGVGVVMDGRVWLRGELVLVGSMVAMAPALMDRRGGGYHGREAADGEPSQLALAGDRATDCEGPTRRV